ncbi:MAG TPA: PTS mannose/fructose/sorbose transporter subunit IIB [Lachnoclostridium sp.]|jgi:fructoselysine and glucoselysine-specific PTS system IIB component|uniref:PTS sugar transporter subunit IIB n=1 Tax=Lacrimispora sp. TaxID=2719234 RepID=UPI000EC52405|nr:PTS sugar transporter subunit IIB [Lacrimispora sp.]HCD42828.1 PTS mannose/fructose/sorbose transporter subunit IIB [Lachnoclostridium sp.]
MIKMVRVDHRLLHGQVAFAWTKTLGVDCILIANDEVAKDTLRMGALRMAAPSGVKLVIKSMEDSIANIKAGKTDKYNLFILLESIEDAYRLTKEVPEIKFINLGGIKSASDKRQISKAIFVSDQDCDLLRKMNDKDVKLEIRMVPDEKPLNAMDLI